MWTRFALTLPRRSYSTQTSRVPARWRWGIAASIASVVTIASATAFLDGKTEEKERLQKLKERFSKFASAEQNGVKYMNSSDFLKAITLPYYDDPEYEPPQIDAEKWQKLFDIADQEKTGLIKFESFLLFENLLSSATADYELAFRIFDRDQNGKISKEEFKKVLSATQPTGDIPFDFDCDLIKMYFGHTGELSYAQFTQLLKQLQQEKIRQEFKFYDKTGTGYISGDAFANIVKKMKLQKIPKYMLDNLSTVVEVNQKAGKPAAVDYAMFNAFNNILLHIPSYGRVLTAALNKYHTNSISKEQFLRAAQGATTIEITPMEVELIYHFFDIKKDGQLDIDEFKVATSGIEKKVVGPVQQAKEAQTFSSRVAAQLQESVMNFSLGAVAGGLGATAVYPIDLVKTRMQNQRTVDAAKKLYKNSFDCFWKVLTQEGFVGLYKGLIPQLVGVAPEKAIKLTVNDLLRGLFEDKSRGEIYFPLEVLAGGGAGASQVIFTNPIEIVKIRLQTQGLTKEGGGAMTIVRELGLTGLYRGAGACLLRDIPFSAIYFPTYAKMKTTLRNEKGELRPQDLLLAGAVAGIPAASLVTPADVIKTRLQVKARTGETTYDGIRDCFWKILKQEGPTAFFKGCVARVFRSSPQFGVTLLSYELLQGWLAPNIKPRPPTNAPVTEKDIEDAFRRSSVVQRVEEMERKWGTLLGTKKE